MLEFDSLDALFENAKDNIVRNHCADKLSVTEDLVQNSVVSVNMRVHQLLHLLRHEGGNFAPYLKLTRAEVHKAMWDSVEHAFRATVDVNMFPGYEDMIVFGALCPLNDGIISYGPCTVLLSEEVYGRRVSLLVEDSYAFFNKNYRVGDDLPEGFRSTWNERYRLAVVKCANDLTKPMSRNDIANFLAHSNGNFMDDEFIEAHIYGVFDARAIDKIRLSGKLNYKSDPAQWEEIKDLAEAATIECSER